MVYDMSTAIRSISASRYGIGQPVGPARRQRIGRVQLSWFIACLIMVSWLVQPVAAESPFKVGMGREVITPAESMWMSGYGARDRPADGKLTELWAKALAIEDAASEWLVLVTLDLVGIDRETAEPICICPDRRYPLGSVPS